MKLPALALALCLACTSSSPAPLAELALGSGSEPIVGTVEAPLLIVRVEDQRGRMLRPVLRFEPYDPLPELGLFCRGVDDQGHVLSSPDSKQAHGSLEASGEVRFELEPGTDYVLGLVARDHEPLEEAARIPAGRRWLMRTIHLGAAVEPGNLDVDVEGPGGKRLDVATNLKLSLAKSGRQIGYAVDDGGQVRLQIELAPGRYRVRGDNFQPVGMDGGADWGDPYGAAELELEVRSGETTRQTLQLVATGRVEFHVTATSAPDLDAWPAPEVETSYYANDPMAVRIRLAPTNGSMNGSMNGREPFDVSFFSPEHRTYSGPLPGETLAAGTEVLVGDYQAIAKLPGFAPLELSLVIQEGKLTRVELEFP